MPMAACLIGGRCKFVAVWFYRDKLSSDEPSVLEISTLTCRLARVRRFLLERGFSRTGAMPLECLLSRHVSPVRDSPPISVLDIPELYSLQPRDSSRWQGHRKLKQ
ncbi:hypothetical protein PsorP6_009837 [Peronosclerospora sorghi]|uniref:Uncharacterized protein n=1 Tax=Peronosclerospora sorghi TaxID=230839 RepID=A0ACC0W0L8_9STRA|nr:hypothetical protein PsorP6_009837 [Peronosclerospora sorghi]